MSASAATAGRIGPNAMTRVAEVLPVHAGRIVAEQVFARAGLLEHWRHPPEAMVDETEVARLHATLRETLGEREAARVARAAGTRTGDYLLAHRIPKPVQWLLKRLPAALAARVLLAAITKHARPRPWSVRPARRQSRSTGPEVRLKRPGRANCCP